MDIDPETGRCKCATNISLKWADTWKSFDIEITTKLLKFRDLPTEASNAAANKVKKCRIGNEGSMYDSVSNGVSKEELQIRR